MASPIQLIQRGTTTFPTVTCQPKRRRIAWPSATSENTAAAMRQKILGVISHVDEKIPSSYLFAEGCDRIVVVPVHLEYSVQIGVSEHFRDPLVGGDQLEVATPVSGRDKESN
jgi:hypothetical protein